MSINLPGINPNYEAVKGGCATIALGLDTRGDEYVLHCGVIVGNDLVLCVHDETDDVHGRCDEMGEEIAYILLDNGLRHYRFANARFDQNGKGVEVRPCAPVPEGGMLLLQSSIDDVLQKEV